MVALVESYIIVSAGLIFLGFGGSRFTSDFVQKYIGYAVAIGVKLFMLYLIIGVGMHISSNWATTIQAGDDLIENGLIIMGGSLIFLFLSWSIPNMAASMLSGAPALTAGGAGAVAAGAIAGTIATSAITASGDGKVFSAAKSFSNSGSANTNGSISSSSNASNIIPSLGSSAYSVGKNNTPSAISGLSSIEPTINNGSSINKASAPENLLQGNNTTSEKKEGLNNKEDQIGLNSEHASNIPMPPVKDTSPKLNLVTENSSATQNRQI